MKSHDRFVVELTYLFGRSGVTHSVLNDAVYAYSCETRDPRHDDFLRAFFRHQVADIGLVVTKIPDQTVRASQETGRAIIDLLPEANRIVLVSIASFSKFSCVTFVCRLSWAQR